MAVGIDVHKEKCAAFARFAGTGEPRRRNVEFLEKFNEDFNRFTSDAKGMTELADRLRDHEAEVLIENSTKSHDVYWMLTNLGIKVTVAHATDLYAITRSVDKNDTNDARKLSGYMWRVMMGQEDEFSRSHIPSRETLLVRELCRFDLNDRTELTALKCQIRSHMLIRGWKLTRKYQDITSTAAIRELRATGDYIFLLDVAKAEEIKKRKTMTEKMIRHKLLGNRMFDIVWSIPGFGILSAAYVTCMADDLSRFGTDREFAASTGLIPMQRESADKPKDCPISRRGDADLRRLLCQAAFVHIFHEESFITEKYRRLKAAGKHHNEALVACANSMARLVWTLVTKDRIYVSDPKAIAAARAEAESDDLEDLMGKMSD
jgi:transposase